MSKGFDYQGVANTVAANLNNRANAAAVGQFLNTALLTYQAHLERQKQDDTANAIMAASNKQNDLDYAVANAKKAAPELYDDGTPIFDDVVAPDQRAAYNANVRTDDHPDGFGYTPGTIPAAPGDLPATGGAAGLRFSMLMDKYAAQKRLADVRSHVLATNGGGAIPATGLVDTPYGKMTPYQASTSAHRDALPPHGGGQGSGAASKPQFDSTAKLNADLNFRWGHDYGEFRDAGPGDTVPQPGGVLYRLGGDKKGPDGKLLPKQEVFMPQAEVDQMKTRVNGLLAGKPIMLNTAQQMYQQRLGAPTATAPSAPAAATAVPVAPAKAQTVQPAAMSADQLREAVEWAMTNRHDKRSDAILEFAAAH